MSTVFSEPRTHRGLSRIFHSWRRPGLHTETWEDNPEYQVRNEWWGSCNTGADAKGVCDLGGIGCNVAHALIRCRNISRLGMS